MNAVNVIGFKYNPFGTIWSTLPRHRKQGKSQLDIDNGGVETSLRRTLRSASCCATYRTSGKVSSPLAQAPSSRRSCSTMEILLDGRNSSPPTRYHLVATPGRDCAYYSRRRDVSFRSVFKRPENTTCSCLIHGTLLQWE